MNTYHIRYRKGEVGLKTVEADSINGFNLELDTYFFKKEGEIVAAIPKSVVVSIEKIDTGNSQ